MDLTINYSVQTNDSLLNQWNGIIDYADTLQTTLSCDSIVTMDLTINYSIATNDSLVACDSAVWNGNVYTTTGIYVDTLQTINSCDSIVTMDND